VYQFSFAVKRYSEIDTIFPIENFFGDFLISLDKFSPKLVMRVLPRLHHSSYRQILAVAKYQMDLLNALWKYLVESKFLDICILQSEDWLNTCIVQVFRFPYFGFSCYFLAPGDARAFFGARQREKRRCC
jgi:hypothetical protein